MTLVALLATLPITEMARQVDPPRPALGGYTAALGVQVHPPHWLPAPRATFDRIRGAGFRWVREDFAWTTIEPQRGKWNWKFFDDFVRDVERSDLRLVGLLAYGNRAYAPPGSEKDPNKWGPVDDAYQAAYVRYASETIRRYRGKGILWEVWNEPDWKFWQPKPNPAAYARLVRKLRREVDRVAPGEILIGPAFSAMNPPFLEEAMREGMLEGLDALSVHPYRQAEPEEMAEDMYRYRAALRRYAPNRRIPLLVSELGYSSSWGPPERRFGEDAQSEFFGRVPLNALANGAELVILYDWQDDGNDPQEAEHRFGLTRRSGAWKDGLYTLSSLSKRLDGYRFAGRLVQPRRGSSLLIFKNGSSVRLVGWKRRGESSPLRLPTSLERFERVDAKSGVGEVDPETARGFDPGAPDTIFADETPVVFIPRRSAGALTALGALPALPATLEVWSRAEARTALRTHLGALPKAGKVVGWTLSERSALANEASEIVRGKGTDLASAALGATVARAADRVSLTGFRMLRIGVTYANGVKLEREALLR